MRCICSLGSHAWYPLGVARLLRSLEAVRWPGQTLFYVNENYPPGCPTRHEVNHGFKPWVMAEAAVSSASSVLWLDASAWAEGDPTLVFDVIERDGYLLVRNGYRLGEWASDAQLQLFGVTRDEAMDIPYVAGGAIGLDLRNPRARAFLDEWRAWTLRHEGAAFNDSSSSDPRVRGIRRDQNVASLVAWKLGMVSRSPAEHGFYCFAHGNSHRAGAVFCFQGIS